ncbi:5-hydroxytryptamine receptor 1A-like isoform X2 [Tribolium madens]|nr:5-hydroxytryptamine receptor 1A-like isoform X2 [Tribolium madens]XP_044263408.1 5-hydroxytryptamine receptor 1A-like isoform X2 [Tribolium madens]XP_044263409.1 5-hydroxytryptamine receptor 1A-like isoform X2 [Tribolium madens]XP_044263410.1 5-hydroxytryptamine receptor 1A-like isoform X2 [Tribolium madens]
MNDSAQLGTNSTEMSVLLKSNLSLDDKDTSVRTQLTLYDILIPTIGGIIMLLNLLVVISSGLILKKGSQPRSTYLFLGNVAMTDLFTGVAVVFGQLYPKENRDHSICALQLGMIVASTLTSVYSVGLIAIDRFLYILHGIQYQQYIYPTRARILILTTWVIGCIVGFMPLFGWYGDTDNGRICWFILLAPRNLVLLTVIIGVIPIILVVILYSIILYHAIKNIGRLQKSTNQTNDVTETDLKNLRMYRGRPQTNENLVEKNFFAKIFKTTPSVSVKSPSKLKAIKVVLFTSGSFVITWSPYFVASLIYVYQCENLESKKCKNLRIIIASPLAILGFTNSLINPIIYAWWHKGFRTYVQKRMSTVIMKTRWKRNSVDNTTKSTSSTSNKQNGSKIEPIKEEAVESRP